MHGHAIDLELYGPRTQLLVERSAAVPRRYACQDIEVASIRAPGGDVHPAQRRGVDPGRKGLRFFVAETLHPQIGV